MELLNNLEPVLKTFWYIAIPVSVIFICQAVMTFMGADSFDGNEADFDGDLSGGHDTFQLFSLRNLTNFLLGFSWAGISLYNFIANKTLLIVVSLYVGIIFVYLFFLIMKQAKKLEEDNSFKFKDALNKRAEVYLPIPGKLAGKGKIIVSVRGSVHELEAATKGEKISSGTLVKIVKIESDNLLIVENK